MSTITPAVVIFRDPSLVTRFSWGQYVPSILLLMNSLFYHITTHIWPRVGTILFIYSLLCSLIASLPFFPHVGHGDYPLTFWALSTQALCFMTSYYPTHVSSLNYLSLDRATHVHHVHYFSTWSSVPVIFRSIITPLFILVFTNRLVDLHRIPQ